MDWQFERVNDYRVRGFFLVLVLGTLIKKRNQLIPKMLIWAIGSAIIRMNQDNKRIQDRFEVQTYLDRLRYAIEEGLAQVNIIHDRKVDAKRNKKFTNRYTIARLFPDEDPTEAIKRELLQLTVEDYVETVKDLRFPKRTDMVVFGKTYCHEDVYVKIRVELINTTLAGGDSLILVMSFHFAETSFSDSDFPYRKPR